MEVLRFTDSTIVQRVHDYMIKLLKADAGLDWGVGSAAAMLICQGRFC